MTSSNRHSVEQKLIDRCKELGLSDQETELLRDLLGWNNRNGGIPKTYRGIEPQVSIASDSTVRDKTLAQTIAQLVHRLIGDKLMAEVEITPIQTFEKKLGLQRLSIVWLVAQLGLSKKCPEIIDELHSLMLQAPERMPDLVVRRTLGALLAPRQE